MHKLVIAGTIATALIVGATSESYACFISPLQHIKRDPKLAFENYADVFVAQVISAEPVNEMEDLVTLEVGRVLKGNQSKVRTLRQNRGRGCEFSHRIGIVYLFFVNEVEDGSHSIKGISDGDKERIMNELGF